MNPLPIYALIMLGSLGYLLGETRGMMCATFSWSTIVIIRGYFDHKQGY